MEDYPDLKGGVPVTSASERVWGVPKKRKVSDRNPNRGRSRRGESNEGGRKDPAADGDAEEHPETEELGYGADGIRKKKSLQVDVVI